MSNFLKKNFFPIALFVISIVLFLTNYKIGTYLIGWDNLFPEFNFKLNLYRDFFAVWQQYRGLGALDNFAQSSNLIHDLYRLILSLFLPLGLIRWSFVFLMFFAGGLGMYYLLKKITKIDPIAFIVAAFYQFNLGTIQQFFLPFEAFIIHFAFLPWLFLAAVNYLEKKDKKSLMFFFLASFLALPQAFIPTLFAVYFSGIALFLGSKWLINRLKNMKTYLVVIGIIITTNIFWILPAGYAFLTYSKTVASAKNYQMASNDIFYRNNKHGNLLNLALIKGVVLDFQATDYKTNSTHYMMWPWLNHISTPFFFIPAWIFLLLALVGLFKSLKNKNLLPFALVFLFAFFMMGTDIPGISLITNFLRQNVPLFSTIFRFTFTKFSILYVFSYSVMLAVGLEILFNKVKKHKEHHYFQTIIFLILLAVYSFPSFQGHFFYENLAVKIPNEYFQVFDFFKQVNHNERVAVLPIPWYWAWLQPRWGTINSGFIWYGIPQPVTDMAFTPWGKANENFYWELDQAVFSKNPSLIEKVLNKYDIGWVYLDKNIVNEPGKKMTFEIYEDLLNKTNGISLAGQFGQISVFHNQLKNNLKDFSEIKNNLKTVSPMYKYDNLDQAYSDYGDYLSTDESQIFYPFRSLFSGKNPEDIEFIINEDENFLYFKSQLPKFTENWSLQKESPLDDELKVLNKDLTFEKYEPEIYIENNTLFVKIDKNKTSVYKSENDSQFLNQLNNSCAVNKKGLALIDKINETGFQLTSINSNNCIKIELPKLAQRYGYLFNIKSVSDKKQGLFMNLINRTTDKIDLETYIKNDGAFHNDFLVTSPRGFYDLGYTMYFNNISEGSEEIVNNLEEVNVYQISYYFLKNLKIVNNISNRNQVYYLSQAYNPGWVAFSDGKILPHVLVNNWANGWLVEDPTKKITVVFWPQYLEFLGFGLLIITFVFVIKYKHETNSNN